MEELSPLSSSPVSAGYDYESAFKNSMNSALESYSKTINQSPFNTFDKTRLDPFQYQETYKPEYFSPYSLDNNTRFTQMETIGSTLAKSFDDFSYKYKNSFGEYWDSYVRLGHSLFTADLSHLEKTQSELMKDYYNDHINEMKNKIFMTPEEEDSFFNKQFLKDFLGNAGFTLGTFSALALEIGFDLGLEALTFGAASPVLAGKWAARTGSALSKLDNVADAVSGFAQGAKLSNRSREEILALKSMGNTADPQTVANLQKLTTDRRFSQVFKENLRALQVDLSDVKNTVGLREKFLKTLDQLPVIGGITSTTRKAMAASEAGLSTANIAGLTFSGFKRSLAEFNLASSEAVFESVSAYGSTFDELVNKHYEETGQAPDSKEMRRLSELALEASSNNYASNNAILLASNKLAFGNIFSKFAPTNKHLRSIMDDTVKPIVSKTGFNKAAKPRYYDNRTFLKRLGNYKDMAKNFGSRYAALETAKVLGKSAFQFQISEGLQENLQETSLETWKDYFVAMYSNESPSFKSALYDGLGSQMSKEGLKTFLIGALTGSITAPITGLSEYAFEKAADLKYKNKLIDPVTGKESIKYDPQHSSQQDKIINNLIKDLNASVDPKNVFNNTVMSFKNQTVSSEGMTETAAAGDIYTFNAIKSNSLFDFVKTHKRNNTLDGYLDYLRNVVGENFTESEFLEAFGVDVKETKYKTVKSFVEDVVTRAEKYSKIHEKVTDKVKQVYDQILVNTDDEFYLSGLASVFNTLDHAADIIALNEIRADDAKIRSQELMNKMSQDSILGNVSDFFGTVLSSPQNLSDHLALLTYETDQYAKQDKSLKTKETTEQNDLKLKELNLLLLWKKLLKSEKIKTETGEEVLETKRYISEDVTDNGLSTLFQKLVNIKNKQTGIKTEITADEALVAIKDYRDFLKLEDDVFEYMTAVKAINNPENLLELSVKLIQGQMKAYFGNVIFRMNYIKQESKDNPELEQTLKNLKLDDLIKKVEELYYMADVPYSTISEAQSKIKDSMDEFEKEYKKFYEGISEKKSKPASPVTPTTISTPSAPSPTTPAVLPPVEAPPTTIIPEDDKFEFITSIKDLTDEERATLYSEVFRSEGEFVILNLRDFLYSPSSSQPAEEINWGWEMFSDVLSELGADGKPKKVVSIVAYPDAGDPNLAQSEEIFSRAYVTQEEFEKAKQEGIDRLTSIVNLYLKQYPYKRPKNPPVEPAKPAESTSGSISIENISFGNDIAADEIEQKRKLQETIDEVNTFLKSKKMVDILDDLLLNEDPKIKTSFINELRRALTEGSLKSTKSPKDYLNSIKNSTFKNKFGKFTSELPNYKPIIKGDQTIVEIPKPSSLGDIIGNDLDNVGSIEDINDLNPDC